MSATKASATVPNPFLSVKNKGVQGASSLCFDHRKSILVLPAVTVCLTFGAVERKSVLNSYACSTKVGAASETSRLLSANVGRYRPL